MCAQLKDGQPTGADQKPPLDPLRRVFVPIERKNVDGTSVFTTRDNVKYVRGLDGAIRRAVPKVKRR